MPKAQFSQLNISISLTPDEEPDKGPGWVTRQLLRVPEPWLEAWGLKINAAAGVFAMLWCAVSLVLTAGGVFRHWGLTLAQGLLIQVAWVPVMAVSTFLVAARSAHMLARLDYHSAMMTAAEAGMMQSLADAVSEGVQRAQAGGDVPPDGPRPTLQ